MTGSYAREQIEAAVGHLPVYLGQHILISTLALALSLVISLPLAMWASRTRTIRWAALSGATVIQTIPSIALLALFYPLLLAVSFVTERLLGVQFSALGFLPTVIALTLYGMLPMLRNTVTGILSVEPAVVEAARGMGMTTRQILWRIELPLAAPVIIAGIRTATVWVVGIATLSTPVGQTSLGNYIFTGLQTENWVFVLFGCVAAAGLAMALDQLIALAEAAMASRRRPLAALAVVGLLAIVGGGLFPLVQRREADLLVGTKTFEEQFILAEVIKNRLVQKGFNVRVREGLGSTVIFRSLASGEIDCYVDYTGTIWANHMRRDETEDRRTVLRAVTRWLEDEHEIVCLGALGFENAYALAMRADHARALGITSIADLTDHARSMKIGGDFEFFGRPEWQRLRDAYGLSFAEKKQYQSTFMYRAVRSGEVDVISAFTSDGRINAYDLLVLEDPKEVIPPYDAILLLSARAARRPDVRAALQPLIGAIPVEVMRQANYRVDRQEDKNTVPQAAHWLDDQIGGGSP